MILHKQNLLHFNLNVSEKPHLACIFSYIKILIHVFENLRKYLIISNVLVHKFSFQQPKTFNSLTQQNLFVVSHNSSQKLISFYSHFIHIKPSKFSLPKKHFNIFRAIFVFFSLLCNSSVTIITKPLSMCTNAKLKNCASLHNLLQQA